MEALTKEYQELMGMFPDAVPFLELRKTRNLPYTSCDQCPSTDIAIKMAKTGLGRHVNQIINAVEVGCATMHEEFWQACRPPSLSTLRARSPVDDAARYLEAGHMVGIRYLSLKAQLSSRRPP